MTKIPSSFNDLKHDEKIKFWQEIEAKIRKALELCATQIREDVLIEVDEYLMHNELGLAWESLCQALIESYTIPSKLACQLILETGLQMGFNQPTANNYALWQKIEILSK